MKKLSAMAIIFITLLLLTHSVMAVSGEGTEGTPFIITNQEELLLVSDFPDCHFVLANDIELTGTWTPLCTNSENFTGTFDGQGHTISNLYVTSDGLFESNYGIIKNLKVITSESKASKGGITGSNYGTISQCIFEGDISSSSCSGAICLSNYGTIEYCRAISNVSSEYSAGGIAGRSASSSSCITNSYFIGAISGGVRKNIGSASYPNYEYYYAAGICGYSSPNYASDLGYIENCFAVATYDSNYKSGIGCHDVTNSFYDTTVSKLTGTAYGTPKSTLAMKMKKTYTDAGWDFENVWGIDPAINDGYPYLLWEYEDFDAPTITDTSASVNIINAVGTANSLKFISKVNFGKDAEIESFGTMFIPLWLFDDPNAECANVEYANSEYNIASASTYGATLSGIPEDYTDMPIVGKSYLVNVDGEYVWSPAKYASAEDTALKGV